MKGRRTKFKFYFLFFKKRTVRHSGHTWTEVETPAGRLPNKIWMIVIFWSIYYSNNIRTLFYVSSTTFKFKFKHSSFLYTSKSTISLKKTIHSVHSKFLLIYSIIFQMKLKSKVGSGVCRWNRQTGSHWRANEHSIPALGPLFPCEPPGPWTHCLEWIEFFKKITENYFYVFLNFSIFFGIFLKFL